MKNYYQILNILPTSDDVVIQAAYKALMRKYHPDTNNSADATRRASDINEAYETLSDPAKRAAYDAQFKATSDNVENSSAWPGSGGQSTKSYNQAPTRQSNQTANGAGRSWVKTAGLIGGGLVLAAGAYNFSGGQVPLGGDDVDREALQACVRELYQAANGEPGFVYDISASVDELPADVYVVWIKPKGDSELLAGMQLSDISLRYGYESGNQHTATLSLTAQNPIDNPAGTMKAIMVRFQLLDEDLNNCISLDNTYEYAYLESPDSNPAIQPNRISDPIFPGQTRQLSLETRFSIDTPRGVPVLTYITFVSERSLAQ